MSSSSLINFAFTISPAIFQNTIQKKVCDASLLEYRFTTTSSSVQRPIVPSLVGESLRGLNAVLHKPTPSFDWAAAGLKVPETQKLWTCSVCMISNKENAKTCAACETER